MATVISLASSKGGSGKTTTALNLAVALAETGRQVLLVDLDPQGGVGLSLAKGEREWTGLAELLQGTIDLDSSIVKTKVETLALLPRGRLDAADALAFEQFIASSGKLQEIVEQQRAQRDFVLLDCPSGLGAVPRAAFAASDFVLVPLQAEPLALRSIGQVLRVIAEVRRLENPRVALLGVLPTMVDLRQDTALNVMGAAWRELASVFDTCIPRAGSFARASELGIPVSFLTERTPPEVRRFRALAIEIETLLDSLAPASGGHDATVPRRLV